MSGKPTGSGRDANLAASEREWKPGDGYPLPPIESEFGTPLPEKLERTEPAAAQGRLKPLDPRRQHHAYGGVEHRTTARVEGCLLCGLEAIAEAWFSFDQQALDVLLNDYRKDGEG